MNIDHLSTANDILRNGVSIVGDEFSSTSSLSYSVGRFEKGWPELAILTDTESDRDAADALLLSTADRPVQPGERIRLQDDGPAWLAVAQPAGLSSDERLHLDGAEAYYGTEVPVLILVQEIEFLRRAPCKS